MGEFFYIYMIYDSVEMYDILNFIMLYIFVLLIE